MNWVIKFAKSSIGAKILMALTGFALFGFTIGHMVGNLQVFAGREALNAYAAFLHSKPGLLWGARLGVVAAFILHVSAGVRLSLLNRAARPVRYAYDATVAATLSSRTMAVSGLLLLAFIVYHLLHFTVRATNPEFSALLDSSGQHDVYQMVVNAFGNPLVTLAYLVAMILLGMHLSHGASSMLQTLGLNHPRYNGLLRWFGPAFAAVIVIGNVSMPLAVLTGYVR